MLVRAQGPTLLDCNYADTCFTAARGSVLAGGCTQAPHRSTLYQHLSVAARQEARGQATEEPDLAVERLVERSPEMFMDPAEEELSLIHI